MQLTTLKPRTAIKQPTPITGPGLKHPKQKYALDYAAFAKALIINFSVTV